MCQQYLVARNVNEQTWSLVPELVVVKPPPLELLEPALAPDPEPEVDEPLLMV